MRKYSTSMIAAVSVATLVLAGCSSKASGGGSGGSGGSGDVKTDFGVTDDTITLGVLTDLTGVFKQGGLGQTQGNELWAKDVNEAGGICGRDIVLDVQDMNYSPDKAVPLYETMKANVLGIVQLLGSPVLAALKQKITTDKVLSVPGSWASVSLDSEAVLMIGQTYDIEAINGLGYFLEEGMIAKGDKVGHIYIDSEYGQNAALGAKYYAKAHDLEIVSAAVSGTDTDMTSTITKLKSEGVKALLLSVAPAATASIALQNASQGLNVPMVGNNPTFSPLLLTDQSVVAALENFYVVFSINSMGSQDGYMPTLLEKYKASYTEPPYDAVPLGYTEGLAWQAILEKACEDGDLTRDGILAARKTIKSVDTMGLFGPLDFSVPGAPPTRVAYIGQADPTGVSGSKVIATDFQVPEAKEYKAPFQK